MSKRKKSTIINGCIIALLALALVFLTEQVLQPGYWVKAAIKAAAFIGAIVIYTFHSGKKFLDVINLHKPKKIGILILCILVFFVGIGVLFFLLRNQIDLSSIKESLMTKERLTKKNCLFVFVYIICVNSFLEEAFFRGFLARMIPNKWVGAIISALLFSVYHIGIVGTWFNVFIFALCIIGLALVGLFLQWLSGKFKTIAASWMVHASANVAINVIGALLIFEVLS
ncbi:MAG: CPBP family intramembrane metalloprotease [Lachnospiraceae bacterium]|nr:CPBP family intramembrane metalloprotease [Lachnospiraceae bacterium]